MKRLTLSAMALVISSLAILSSSKAGAPYQDAKHPIFAGEC
ncbi:MAG: hypothetical protein AAGG02_14000 [Cyanobacteria bacterium P01_H01_bin.15]